LGQQHHITVKPLHQHVIEADFTKFVNDYRSIRKPWLPQEPCDQCRFPAAKETGHNSDRRRHDIARTRSGRR